MFPKSILALLFLTSLGICQDEIPHFASGIKVGEVTQNTAIVWVRLTEKDSADFDRLPIFTEGLKPKENPKIEMPLDIVPGSTGSVRLIYSGDGLENAKVTTLWQEVNPDRDFTHQFQLEDLQANCVYQLIIQARKTVSAKINSTQVEFKTAPEANSRVPVKFIVTTCQAVRSIDSGPEGHAAYRQMQDFAPDFFVHTGDILYYDKVPLCKNLAQARAKWNLMFSYGNNRDFHMGCSSYFMKDDHDTLKNDCWPGQKYGELTFAEGLEIFREQVPMGESTFRTVRWGRDLQIWLTENRDFRSSNRDPDGPNKTILGAKQKAWLKKSISESNATYKFVITPGPIVGPDKRGKADNHSNDAFATEGQELRDFLSAQENTYVICGDRHWQYCSVDPQTGLWELGCGPINDEHKFGGTPGRVEEFHRYFGSQGGFLGITIDGKNAKAEWFHADKKEAGSELPKVLHRETLGK